MRMIALFPLHQIHRKAAGNLFAASAADRVQIRLRRVGADHVIGKMLAADLDADAVWGLCELDLCPGNCGGQDE